MLRSCAVLVRTPGTMGTGSYCEKEAAEGREGARSQNLSYINMFLCLLGRAITSYHTQLLPLSSFHVSHSLIPLIQTGGRTDWEN